MVYTKNAGRMQDDNLVLQDTVAAITASALGTVGGAAANGIVNLGAAPVVFDVVIPISVLKVSANDEEYSFQIIGSTVAAMTSSAAMLGELRLGALEVLDTATSVIDVDSPAGQYILTVRNYTADGTVYPYVRFHFEEVAGTAPSWTPAGDIFIANVRAG